MTLALKEFKRLEFDYQGGFQTDDDAYRTFSNEEHGIYVKIVTKRKRKGDIYSGWKNQKKYYALDGHDGFFDTVEELYDAYLEREDKKHLNKLNETKGAE